MVGSKSMLNFPFDLSQRQPLEILGRRRSHIFPSARRYPPRMQTKIQCHESIECMPAVVKSEEAEAWVNFLTRDRFATQAFRERNRGLVQSKHITWTCRYPLDTYPYIPDLELLWASFQEEGLLKAGAYHFTSLLSRMQHVKATYRDPRQEAAAISAHHHSEATPQIMARPLV